MIEINETTLYRCDKCKEEFEKFDCKHKILKNNIQNSYCLTSSKDYDRYDIIEHFCNKECYEKINFKTWKDKYIHEITDWGGISGERFFIFKKIEREIKNEFTHLYSDYDEYDFFLEDTAETRLKIFKKEAKKYLDEKITSIKKLNEIKQEWKVFKNDKNKSMLEIKNEEKITGMKVYYGNS